MSRGAGRRGTTLGPIKGGSGPITTDPLPDPITPIPDPIDDARPPRKPRVKIKERPFVFNRQNIPLRVTYGPAHCRGANLVYFKRLPSTGGTANGGRKLVVYYLEWGPGSSISNITIDGKTLAQLGLTVTTDYNLHLGDGATSLATDALMTTHQTGWAAASHPSDVVALVVLFKRPSTALPEVDVTAIEYDSGGIKVYDPDQDAALTTKYARSDNPRLAIADMETDTRYGGNFPTSVVYSEPSFQDAVDDCDTDLGGGRKRYTIGLSIEDTQDFDACIDMMRGQAALCYAYSNGYRKWWVDLDRTTSGITFENGQGQANVVSAGPLKYKGSAEIPTKVIVNFTNAAAGNKKDFAYSEHPSLGSGSVELVEWSYDYWGITTYDQAKRIADYIRKSHTIDKFGTIRVKAEGLRLLPGSLITIGNLVEWNVTTSTWKVLKVAPTQNASTWDLTIEPYDSSVFSDTLQTTTSYTPPANPTPYDTPVAPLSPAGAGSLTVGDGFTEQSDGKYRVSWSVVNWPYGIRYRLTVQYGSGSETTIYEGLDATALVDRSVLPTVRVYAVVAQSGATSTALSGSVGAVTPPDVIDFIAQYSTTPATVYFTAPKTRSATLYGSSFWSQSGLSSFTASRVNDGLTALAAFTSPGATVNSPLIEYATTTAGPWTTATKNGNSTRTFKSMGGGITRYTLAWSDNVARRAWSLLWGSNRLMFDAGVGNTKTFREAYIYLDGSDNVMEVQFLEFGSDVLVRGYRVYSLDVSDNRTLAMPEIIASAIPTSTKPLDLEVIATREPSTRTTSGSDGLRFLVTAVSQDGTESEGARYSSFTTASAATAGVGRIASQVTTVGNVGTGEDDLFSVSVAGSDLALDGDSIRFEAWGAVSATAATRTLRTRMIEGANNRLMMAFDGFTAGNASDWHVFGTIMRASSTTLRAAFTIVFDDTPLAGSGQVRCFTHSGTLTWANGATLKLTGQCSTATDNALTVAGVVVQRQE